MTTDFLNLKRRQLVKGLEMAYIDEGHGSPIVFLHGNPTSSYLWRNIFPYLKSQARVIVPDLIVMGDSDKLRDSGPGSYRFVEHREYLDLLLEGLGVNEEVVMVGSDWGSALAMDWAFRNQEKIKGLVYMEAIVMEQSYDEVPKERRDFVRAFKSVDGERLMLKENVVVDVLLQLHQQRKFTPEELAEYRRPFLQAGEGRRPTLTWAREQPWDGEPADVLEIINDFSGWMTSNSLPKLLISGNPGALLTGKRLAFCRSWPNQSEVQVDGLHNIQEDSPDEIGEAISSWYARL